MLVPDLIRLGALRHPEKVALVGPRRSYDYAELNALINRIASALLARGVSHGDRVASLGRNSVEYVALYYAVARIGAMLVPLNYWHRPNEHDFALGDSEPSILFIDDEFTTPLTDVIAQRSLPTVSLPTHAESPEWDEFLASATGDDEPKVTVERDDPHMILYTSGTTGRPKGALLSHARTTDDALAMAAALRVRPSDTFLNFFPPFHVAHWDHMKMYHLMGGTVVLLPQFDPGAVVRAVEEHRVTVLLAVPAMLREIFGHADFSSADLSSIRLLYYGAYDPSGFMLEVADHFGAREGRIEMFHTYGLTEAGPFVAICDSEDLFDNFGSIGRAMPGVELALLDDEGRAVPQGSPGEICVKGPRMIGYWRNPEGTAEALAGGWLHTGDVAVADEHGFLRIVDRKKDTIRSGGQNVYSKQVEDCLLLHDRVQDCAVIGLPDPVYEEKVVAVVVPEGGEAGEDLAAEIQAFVRQSLAGYHVPKQIVFVDALPKSSVGKTLKTQLRQEYGSVFDPRPAAPGARVGG